jgi:DNA polymerase I-like protein with 3'-5' exonuclease and polymerase domains
MQPTLYYIGSVQYTNQFHCNATVDMLIEWINQQDFYQLDTETNVTNNLPERQLRVLQFGSLDGMTIWVIQWSYLSAEDKAKVIKALNDKRPKKIIHNSNFEYTLLEKYGVVLENIWDTFVMEEYIYAGYDYDASFFALAEVMLRRYEIDMSKAMQTEFGNDQLNDDKIIYAASDVLHLGKLYEDQKKEIIEIGVKCGISEKEALRVPYWENEAALAYGDMTCEGFALDIPRWMDNIAKAKPIIEEAKSGLRDAILERFPGPATNLDINAKVTIGEEDKLDENGSVIAADQKVRKFECKAILPKDTFMVNWNSADQKLEVLQLVFSDLTKTSTAELRKYLQVNDPDAPKLTDTGKKISPNGKVFTEKYIYDMKPTKFVILKLAVLGKWDKIEEFFLANFKDLLVEKGFYFAKDSMMINWNSNPQKLQIFKWFDSQIENTDAQTVKDHMHTHKFFPSFKQYTDANSLVTKFGSKFVLEHVEPDGRVRTRFDQIKSTGRISSSQPNMQQIPANALPPERQNDYRNCFIPGRPGWKVVSADYASQELAIIATLSREPLWLDALKTGKDLHSVSAEMLYGTRWKEASAEISGAYPKNKDGTINVNYKCEYYELGEDGLPKKDKCKCPMHKKMRNDAKAMNFGLAYGLGAPGLSVDLKISVEDAQRLMDDYFKAFPNIKTFLDRCGKFGRDYGYIRTPYPLHRIRTFPYWEENYGDNFWMGKAERASKNTPVQGMAADMTKIAFVLCRRWINNNNLRDHIKLVLTVHDQVDSICSPHVDPKIWGAWLQKLMEQAAEICLRNTLLKADVTIGDVWQK